MLLKAVELVKLLDIDTKGALLMLETLLPATSVSVEVVAMLNDMEPEATPELGVPTTVYTLLVPTWVMVPTEPLVNAKSAAVGALFSASLKVTVKVSAALVVVAAILSVADTIGATVSMP